MTPEIDLSRLTVAEKDALDGHGAMQSMLTAVWFIIARSAAVASRLQTVTVPVQRSRRTTGGWAGPRATSHRSEMRIAAAIIADPIKTAMDIPMLEVWHGMVDARNGLG